MTDSDRSLEVLHARGATEPVEIAIVLGTGLGSIADAVENAVVVPYADLPGFPQTVVSGHEGRLVIGSWEGTRVAIMQGRAHYYETGNAAAMETPLETLALLGAQILVLTNSAGSMHVDWYPGNIAMISDHINFSGINPLIGAGTDSRFVPLADAYDRHLRARMRRASVSAGTANLREGVYLWFSGPSFETAAEVKVAKVLGADLVGMSTVPEVILARFHGLRVAALSLVTNPAAGLAPGAHTHDDTQAAGQEAGPDLRRLVTAFLRELPDLGPHDI